MRTNRLSTLIIPLLAAALSLSAFSANAQSDQQLRQENQRLRTENEDLKRELEAARQAIAQLQQQLRALEQVLANMGTSGTQSGGSGSTAAPTPPPVSIDESKPDASPRALLEAIKKDHEEALKEVAMGEAGSRERLVYNRALEKWIAAINRSMRMPIEWIVRLEDGQRVRGGYELKVQAIDPVHHETEFGDAFVIMITDAQARRMSALNIGDRLALKGTLSSKVQYNGDREASGPFNNPPLIGPFVEFGFEVDPSSLVPAPKEEKKDQKPGASGTGSGGSK